MESFGDKLRACVFALLVHVALVAVLSAGLFWTKATRPVQLRGPVIEAELVGLTAAPRPQPKHQAKPKPAKPKAEQPPKPPEPKPQPPSQPQKNDRVEREKVAELAKQAEKARRAQEERQHQEQVLLKQQQQKERERQRQLAEIRRQQEALDRRLKLEREKLAQLQDLHKQKQQAPAQPVPQAARPRSGNNGTDDSLWAQYQAAIQNAVTDNWLRPDSAQPGLRCMLRIVQIPGGDVISVKIVNPCNADPLTRNSIEQAVKRAEPLPYKGFEKVFQRKIDFNFTYDG